MTFIGDDTHGDVDVRARIASQCLRYGAAVCRREELWSHELLILKASSVFCLEPAGDAPFRRSISDSVVLGCIPVIFNDATDHFGETVRQPL